MIKLTNLDKLEQAITCYAALLALEPKTLHKETIDYARWTVKNYAKAAWIEATTSCP